MSEPVTAISTRFTNRSAAAGLILTRAERTVCPPGLSAITRFMTDKGISMRMHAIDDLGIYGRKQKGNNQVVVDWSRWPRKYPFDCNRNASLATVNRNATALDWEPELEPEGEAATRRSR